MESLSLILANTAIPPIGGFGLLAMLLWLLAGLLMGWYLGKQVVDIRYATLADGQQQVRQLPLTFKLLLPFVSNVKRYKRSKYQALREKTTTDLVSAGYDTVISASDYLSLRFLVPLSMTPVIMVITLVLTSQLPPGGFADEIRERQLLFFLCMGLYFYMRPRTWLKQMIKTRHRQIEKGLPFVLDLLTLSVEAGLDFMTAIRRLVEKRKVDALSEEFIRAVREMQVGRTRKEALKDMAERAQQPDLSSVVSALVQADELGVGIGTVLRIQAEQMRQRRFQRAEKLANEAPVKLLFPLVCFIFPSVFLVLLGPIFLQMLQSGF